VIETGGFVLLFAWLIFAALLTVLGYLILRGDSEAASTARHRRNREQSSTKRTSSRTGS
jgi:hypothetical protein